VSAERRTRWSAPDLLTAVFPDPKWAVPGVIAEGLNLLAGAPKIGKSFMAFDLAVAVASGGKALGRVDVDPGDVLYLALEDTPRRLKTRLRKILQGEPAPDRLTIAITSKPLDDGGDEQMCEWLRNHPGARLVIVDVFARIRGRALAGTSAYDNDYAPAAKLKAIADEYGVAILLLHHTRKAEANDYMDEVSGTQGLNGAADATLILKRVRGSADATLNVAGRDIEEASYAMRFAPDIGAWQMLDEPAGDYELGDTRHAIKRHLRVVGSSTPKAIAEALDLNRATVRQTMGRMSGDGQVRSDGRGAYTLPVTPDAPVSPVTPVTPSQIIGVGDTCDTCDTCDMGDMSDSCVCVDKDQERVTVTPTPNGRAAPGPPLVLAAAAAVGAEANAYDAWDAPLSPASRSVPSQYGPGQP
jgi:hypothetical protein